jgi:DNA recombination protein RmuC
MILEQQRTSDAQGETRFKTFEVTNEQKLEAIRLTVERRLIQLQTGNAQKLDEMRKIVDEKLQKTLETKVAQSFQLVNDGLSRSTKALARCRRSPPAWATKEGAFERQERGILGEIQLGAILEEILAPEQYETNVATKPGSSERVEYASNCQPATARRCFCPSTPSFPPTSTRTAGRLRERRSRSGCRRNQRADHAHQAGSSQDSG